MENTVRQDPRFRRAIADGDYTRAVSIFLRITVGGETATMDDQRAAASCVFDAIAKKHEIEEKLLREGV